MLDSQVCCTDLGGHLVMQHKVARVVIFVKAEEFLSMYNLRVDIVENLRKEKVKYCREGQRVLELEPFLMCLIICMSGMNLEEKKAFYTKKYFCRRTIW